MPQEIKMSQLGIHGATTVGIICKDGVVLASEKKVSWGRLLASRSAKKVFKLTDNIGLAFAGLISDMQALARDASAYASLFELDHNRPISTKAMAKLISNILFQRRMVPLLMETVVGGMDGTTPNLYSMDPLGSLISEDYVSAGSGAPIAVGVLEDQYNNELTLEEGAQLAIKAIKAASARDVTSGAGIDLLLISEEGTEERTETLPPMLQT